MNDVEAIYRLIFNLMWSANPQPCQKSKPFLKSLKSILSNFEKDTYNKAIEDCQAISGKYRRSEEEKTELEALIKK